MKRISLFEWTDQPWLPQGYTWEVGRLPIPRTAAHLTYVLGKAGGEPAE